MTSNTLIKKYWDNDPRRIREMYYLNSRDNIEGVYEEYHPNGYISGRIEYINGKRHGKYEVFYNTGQISKCIWYVQDQIRERFTKWGMNGQLINDRWYNNLGQCDVHVSYTRDGENYDLEFVVLINVSSNISIEGGAFLGSVISELVTEGREYDIKYFE
jgi:antitoxin component YwqK of YwqJK toxin-antitoxin module